MIGSYIKIARRTLKKNKLVSFINIFGLGLSMSVGMMVMVILETELSYDHFHPYPDRTSRIISTYHKNDGARWSVASTPLPLYQLLKEDTAEIEDVVNLYPELHGKVAFGTKELDLNGAFTEPSFFTVFGFKLASGNPETALMKPNDIVLTANAAEKFFGREDPMGKIISWENKGNFVVTGILAKDQGKSHIDFDAYAPASAISQLVQNNQLPDKSGDWGDCMAAYTYVLMKKDAGTNTLHGQLNSVAERINKEDKQGKLSFATQPIEKIKPSTGAMFNDIGGGTSWSKLWVEIEIALLILLAACFNYTNLCVARALTRAREVGVRKIAGAKRYQIFMQYIIEACLNSFLALLFAWMLLIAIIHWAPFNDDYEMIPSAFKYSLSFVLFTLGYALLTGFLAGIAPAWILSSFDPLRVLKNLVTAKVFGKIGLQKVLIVFQYSLSLIIFIFLFSFYRQFTFMAAADPGFKRDNVLVVPLDGVDEKIASNAISGTGGVQVVSSLSTTFRPHYNGMRGPGWIDNAQKGSLTLNYFFTDATFIPAMQIRLLAGRNFSERVDTAIERNIIINTKAARSLGYANYENALGKKLWVNDSTALEVIGVVQDFAYENAGKPVDPMAFRNKKGASNYLFISVDKGDKTSVVRRISQTWSTFAASRPFSYSWLDDDLERKDSQRAVLSLLGYLAFMTISIATLGLLGLVIYSVEVKRKEISIRKVIGASNKQLVTLLSAKFIKLLVIAGAIGLPIGYTLSYLFQQNFVARVRFLFPFSLLCFVLLLGIGLVTIISQTYKASREKPTKNLKVE
ncbi:ABC transporter permease [Flavitalea sp. BT771]|uniref:ABC transporter permease n=1 Tax=Flavitalea sp. BT771 TaxID=3063329 RepID=UPI0026E2DC8F|nr:ABC transporter permease [Flavitalea sp. BT771]MDO6428950.1 ABC transporter permease [Flavitalea sp. BT771]MDV6218922.1 ABC transporter permease [Flavitalea sp. BT771]